MMRMWKKAKLLGPVGCRTLSKAGYQRLYPRRIEGSQDVGHRGHIFSVRPVCDIHNTGVSYIVDTL